MYQSGVGILGLSILSTIDHDGFGVVAEHWYAQEQKWHLQVLGSALKSLVVA